jgi:hypothetical protein
MRGASNSTILYNIRFENDQFTNDLYQGKQKKNQVLPWKSYETCRQTIKEVNVNRFNFKHHKSHVSEQYPDD